MTVAFSMSGTLTLTSFCHGWNVTWEFIVVLQPRLILIADSRLIMQRTSVHFTSCLLVSYFKWKTDLKTSTFKYSWSYKYLWNHLTYDKLEQSPSWGRMVPPHSPQLLATEMHSFIRSATYTDHHIFLPREPSCIHSPHLYKTIKLLKHVNVTRSGPPCPSMKSIWPAHTPKMQSNDSAVIIKSTNLS